MRNDRRVAAVDQNGTLPLPAARRHFADIAVRY